ncbi:MAG TPA: hypothetical protein VK211_29065 [Kamptonema sp.]|nr:hypothetical protein [Kamptonema sp.]
MPIKYTSQSTWLAVGMAIAIGFNKVPSQSMSTWLARGRTNDLSSRLRFMLVAIGLSFEMPNLRQNPDIGVHQKWRRS